jgi:hypothetical protein
MALIFEMSPQKHDGTPRAPAAREKLQQAEAILAELEADVALLALETSEGKAGAEKALASQRSKIETATRSVSELKRAVILGERLDRESAAGAAARMRTDQFGAFCKHGKERLAAAEKMFEAAAVMATAMQEYGTSTQAMVGVLPAGTALPTMAMGRISEFGGALGNLELLLSAEFWRLGAGADVPYGQRFTVPFGRQPTMGSADHRTMQPAAIVFGEAHAAIVAEIQGQLEKIAAKDMNVATGKPEALKETA